MNQYINSLVKILKKAGHNDEADQLLRKSKPFKIKVDPLTLAVAEGLLNASVLEKLDDDDSSELSDILDELQKED